MQVFKPNCQFFNPLKPLNTNSGFLTNSENPENFE